MSKTLDTLNAITTLAASDKILVRSGTTDYSATLDKLSTTHNHDTLYLKLSGGVLTSDLTVTKILPDMTGATGTISVRDIGDSTHRFNNIWANDVHVGAASLYVNGKQVISDVSDTMTFTTEVDKGINIKTTGAGDISLLSEDQINANAAGGLEWKVPSTNPSKNIAFTNQSASGNITFNSANQIIFNATDSVVANNLSLTGNLTVNGTTTTINTQQLTIEDNLITLNSTQTGTPVTTLVSGIDIERGDENNYRFVFSEIDDTFRIGMVGSLQPVATRDETPVSNGVAYWDATNTKMTTSSNLAFDGSSLTVSSKRVVTVSSAIAFPTSPAPGLGDMCYRTDLDELYFYQGAVWIQI
jgi:hypothetical protein